MITFNNGFVVKDDGAILNVRELYQFDMKTMDDGKYRSYLDEMGKEYGLNNTDVKDVKIVCNTKQKKSYYYSIVSNNPYIRSVLSCVISADIQGEGNYTVRRNVIKAESETYEKIKHFLLDSVKNNGMSFINEYYPDEGKIRSLLIKYYDISIQQYRNSEDEAELDRLERRISQELSIYGNYRNFVKQKYKNENYKTTPVISHKNIDLEPSKKTLERVEKENYEKVEKKDSIQNRINDFNREYEEFIEPEEYDQMTGYTGERVR